MHDEALKEDAMLCDKTLVERSRGLSVTAPKS
jgi:hypothetical protein